ncbi:hypothetical protein HYPSUDRAFT_37011 [Hypholoma sublateritium FD-334 SS-4]|uniref:Chromo domain-containing protein n=1 Tax=Hypholoma sublateritium (strain FD-334 SS-4) TaxID=945553 RepID=A0A0D2LF03_HYPSF|nr:hypothetical protein HYPSUDRAFT_37011 [Hypholoma sublateritium FD-334 SS-4]
MARKKGRKAKSEEVFHVEVVTKTRVVAPEHDGDEPSWEYFVKWAGYGDDANSWEPAANLDACQRLLGSFWEHIGTDNQDYHPGIVLEASKDWIKQEKEYFANEYNRVQDEIKMRKNEKGRQKKKDKGKSVSLEPISTSNTKEAVLTDVESSEQSFDEQLTIQASSSRKRKTVISSSSDDEPLLSSKTSRPKKVAKSDNKGAVGGNETTEIFSSPTEKSPTSLFSEPSSPETALSTKKMPNKSLANEMKIPRRGTNRLQANLGSMAPSDIPASHGISTKQRIGQGALAPIPPKEVIPANSRAPPKLNQSTKKTIRSLTFKKLTADKHIAIDPARRSSTNLPPQNEPVPTQWDSPQPQSPTAGLFSSPISASSPSMLYSDRVRVPADEVAFAPEVESFLNSVMPPELSAPMNSASGESLLGEIHPPKPLTKVPLPTRLAREEKEWKWIGPMYTPLLEVPYCHVTIYNPSKEGSLRFSMFFGNMEKLKLLSLYNIVDIQTMLAAFRNPAQMAQLGPSDKDDTARLAVLSQYMVKTHKSFLMPIEFDNKVIGQILCFPYVLHPVFCLKLPAEMYKEGELIMVILAYTLEVETVDPLTNLRDPLITYRCHKSYKLQLDTTSHPCNPDYEHAISMLNIPPDFVNHIAHPQHKRPYMIWTGRELVGAQHSRHKALETRLLQTFLDKAGAQKAGSRSYVRIAFIHLSALKSIQDFPEFVERRAGRAHQQLGRSQYPLQFYLYGSDASIHPSTWHVHEIWPCGGIVTFTPNSIAKDPLGSYNLMVELSRHPLWASYIVPAALGMLASIACGTGDPLKIFDQHTLGIDRILQAIEDGMVALLEAPPERPAMSCAADLHAQWVSEYYVFLPPTRRDALAQGVAAFRSSHSHAIDAEIAANMTRIHRHSAFMYTYRRYIIVCAEGDERKAGPQGAAFEWTTVPQFDFMDDFYPKQTVL